MVADSQSACYVRSTRSTHKNLITKSISFPILVMLEDRGPTPYWVEHPILRAFSLSLAPGPSPPASGTVVYTTLTHNFFVTTVVPKENQLRFLMGSCELN